MDNKVRLLGVDWGEAKIGLAISTGKFAEPFAVLRDGQPENKIKELVLKEGIEKVVVGISEGESGRKAKDFAKLLSTILTIPVETYDETLSTQDAQKHALESGMSRKKRKGLEDSYAAAIMLESYLDQG